jgi:hypothetical protein
MDKQTLIDSVHEQGAALLAGLSSDYLKAAVRRKLAAVKRLGGDISYAEIIQVLDDLALIARMGAR